MILDKEKLRIHFTVGLTNPEREAARIVQAFNLTEVIERNG